GADPLGQNLDQPRLLNRDHEVLRIGHLGQIQRHRREHDPRGRLRGIGRPGYHAVETAVVEQPNRLAGNPIRAPLRVGSGQRLQHDGSDTGQTELVGQHQAVRAGPRDDGVDHLGQLTDPSRGVPSYLIYLNWRMAVATARPRPITAGAVSPALSYARA